MNIYYIYFISVIKKKNELLYNLFYFFYFTFKLLKDGHQFDNYFIIFSKLKLKNEISYYIFYISLSFI